MPDEKPKLKLKETGRGKKIILSPRPERLARIVGEAPTGYGWLFDIEIWGLHGDEKGKLLKTVKQSADAKATSAEPEDKAEVVKNTAIEEALKLYHASLNSSLGHEHTF